MQITNKMFYEGTKVVNNFGGTSVLCSQDYGRGYWFFEPLSKAIKYVWFMSSSSSKRVGKGVARRYYVSPCYLIILFSFQHPDKKL